MSIWSVVLWILLTLSLGYSIIWLFFWSRTTILDTRATREARRARAVERAAEQKRLDEAQAFREKIAYQAARQKEWDAEYIALLPEKERKRAAGWHYDGRGYARRPDPRPLWSGLAR